MNTFLNQIVILAIVVILALQRGSFSILKSIDMNSVKTLFQVVEYENKPAHTWASTEWSMRNFLKKKIMVYSL